MVIAINRIIAMQGGLVIAENGKVLGELPLPIAGLMSRARAEDVAKALTKLERFAKSRYKR